MTMSIAKVAVEGPRLTVDDDNYSEIIEYVINI